MSLPLTPRDRRWITNSSLAPVPWDLKRQHRPQLRGRREQVVRLALRQDRQHLGQRIDLEPVNHRRPHRDHKRR